MTADEALAGLAAKHAAVPTSADAALASLPPKTATVSPTPTSSFPDKINTFAHVAGAVANETMPVLPGIVRAVANPKNTLASGVNLIKAIPEGVKTIAEGVPAAAKRFVNGDPVITDQQLDALKGMVKDKYGSVAKLNDMIANDPAGFAADVATVLEGAGGVGSLAAKAGDVGSVAIKMPQIASKIGLEGSTTIGDLAKTASGVGEAINPINAGARVVSGVISKTGEAAKKLAAVTAALETGKPSDAFLTALDNPTPEYFQYLRDKKPPQKLVNKVGDALHGLAEKEGAAYRSSLGKIKEGSDLASELDITPIKSAVDKKLLDFGVERTGKPMTIKLPGQEGSIKLKNGLDFSNSSVQLNSEAQNAIAKTVAKIEEVGVKPGSATPIQLDMTKRALGNLYSENSDARAFVQGVKKTVADTLKKNVDGYKEMTSRYDNYKDLADEFKAVLGNPDKQSANSVFQKLTNAMNENADFKSSVLDTFQKETGTDLRPALAGQKLSTWVPSGMRQVLASGSLAAKGLGVLTTPLIWPALAMTSPRIMGEFMGAIGIAKSKIGQITSAASKMPGAGAALNAIPKIGLAGIQAERVKTATSTPGVPQRDNLK